MVTSMCFSVHLLKAQNSAQYGIFKCLAVPFSRLVPSRFPVWTPLLMSCCGSNWCTSAVTKPFVCLFFMIFCWKMYKCSNVSQFFCLVSQRAKDELKMYNTKSTFDCHDDGPTTLMVFKVALVEVLSQTSCKMSTLLTQFFLNLLLSAFSI